MRHLVLPSLVTLAVAAAALSGCTTTARHGKRLAKGGQPAKLSDDYTLTGRAAGVNDTSYYLERDDSGESAGLPTGAFAPGSADLADEVVEQMFPEAPGTVEAALGEAGPLIQLFVVTSDEAAVRRQPAEAGELVRPLVSGERLAATVEGSWARVGKDQFVPVSALEPVSGYDEHQRASLEQDFGRSQ